MNRRKSLPDDFSSESQDKSAKFERLGSLFLTLLNTSTGITYNEIRRQMPIHYDDSESSRRKFERDKKDLKEIGIETEYTSAAGMDHVYILSDRLRPLTDYKPDERETNAIAKMLSGYITHLQKNEKDSADLISSLESILYKLLFSAEDLTKVFNSADAAENQSAFSLPDLIENEPSTSHLAVIQSALEQKKIIKFKYPSSPESYRERKAAPRGLLSQRDRWCLVAVETEAGATRHFYLDLMKDLTLTEIDYRPDPKFSIKDYSLHSLSIKIEEPVEMIIRLNPDLEDLFSDFLEGYFDFINKNNLIHLKTANPGAVYSFILNNPDVISGLGPVSVHESFIHYRDNILKLYE
jgi:predicted DNA-binding transcriptional regulator YafY